MFSLSDLGHVCCMRAWWILTHILYVGLSTVSTVSGLVLPCVIQMSRLGA